MTKPQTQPAGLLLCDDLFFGSKVTGTAGELGVKVRVAHNLEGFRAALSAAKVQFVIVDLGLPGLDAKEFLGLLPAEERPHVIAFDAHVRTARLQAARDAGCDEVLSRGQFTATLPEILGRYAEP